MSSAVVLEECPRTMVLLVTLKDERVIVVSIDKSTGMASVVTAGSGEPIKEQCHA